MMGVESCGMLLSAIHNVNGEERLNLVMLDDAIPAGKEQVDYSKKEYAKANVAVIRKPWEWQKKVYQKTLF